MPNLFEIIRPAGSHVDGTLRDISSNFNTELAKILRAMGAALPEPTAIQGMHPADLFSRYAGDALRAPEARVAVATPEAASPAPGKGFLDRFSFKRATAAPPPAPVVPHITSPSVPVKTIRSSDGYTATLQQTEPGRYEIVVVHPDDPKQTVVLNNTPVAHYTSNQTYLPGQGFRPEVWRHTALHAIVTTTPGASLAPYHSASVRHAILTTRPSDAVDTPITVIADRTGNGRTSVFQQVGTQSPERVTELDTNRIQRHLLVPFIRPHARVENPDRQVRAAEEFAHSTARGLVNPEVPLASVHQPTEGNKPV